MKFICAPDSFKGSIGSVAASRAMADGIRDALPNAEVDCCPVGDGGEGTLAALQEAIGGRTRSVQAHDAYGDAVTAPIGNFAGQAFCWVESATVIGLPANARMDIMSASTYGVGELILAALDEVPARLLVGIGGSATTDGGCGMAQALGVRFFDASGVLLGRPIAGGSMRRIDRIDIEELDARLAAVDIVAACDVTNPLTGANGAARVYGPQKGATPDQVAELDDGLDHLARIVRRDLGIDMASMPGSGAAGGLGAGLVAFAGAELASGIDTVLDIVDFEARVSDATLCLTGEGRLDAQSLTGKACTGVARIAGQCGVPTVALVGAKGPGAARCLEAGIDDIIVIGEGLPVSESIRRAGELLRDHAARIARGYL